MKKAFSLFELVITLVLLGVLFALFSKPLINIFHLYSNSQRQDFINANASLLFVDKTIKKCLDFTLLNQGFECLLEDSENTVLQRQNTAFIGSSGVLLQDKNSSFYAPKSHFLYTAELENGKFIKAGVLENQKDLHNNKNKDFLYLYALKDKEIYKAKVLDKEKIAFINDTFKGSYKLIDAKISIELKKDELIYTYSPYLSNISHKGVLLSGVKEFSVDKRGDGLRIRICVFENTCFEKWSLR